jgi:gingipain R
MQTLGGLFYSGQMKMLDDYNNADGREVIETWVFFGDPSTMIRTDIPQDLAVTHLSSELVGVSSLTVFSSTEDAVVTLKSNDSIISKSTVQNGQALLQFNSIELPDTLEIVVSAYNKVPYFGQFIVKDLPNPFGTANELLIGPNPVDLNGSLHLIFELESDQEVSFNIFNQLGQMVFSNVVDLDQGFYGPNYTDVSIDLRKIGITTGQYIINAKYNGQTFSKTFFVP